jgi:flagellar biogenesis protein FliO
LNLAPTSGGASASWTVLLVFGLAAAGLWYGRRYLPQPAAAVASGLKILHRAPIGVRSELLVVEVCGQRMLLGVTPSAVQHLAALDTPEGSVAAPEEPTETVSARFESMLTAAARRSPALVREPERPRPTSEAPREVRETREAREPRGRASRRAAQEPVEEQARGLLALAERP